MQDRDGNTFYIIIDYDKPLDEEGDQYETYFLNLVDTADLAALAEDSGEEAAALAAKGLGVSEEADSSSASVRHFCISPFNSLCISDAEIVLGYS